MQKAWPPQRRKRQDKEEEEKWEVVNPETDGGGRYASYFMCSRVYPRPGGSPIHWAMAEEVGGEDGVSTIFYFSYTTIVSRQTLATSIGVSHASPRGSVSDGPCSNIEAVTAYILVTKLTSVGEPRPSQSGRVSGGPCWLGRELTATKFALHFGTVKYWNWI